MSEESKGFIYVATLRYMYYASACYSAETLREHYPDAKITLYTLPEWVDGRADVFDEIVTDIPNNIRTKLWACARSPYDKTMYIDADTEICSDEIQQVWDQLGDNDLVMTKVRDYSGAIVHFGGGSFTWHCGIYAYNSSRQHVRDFMQAWWRQWLRQEEYVRAGNWMGDHDESKFPFKRLVHFDTFGFWKITELDGWIDKLSIAEFDNDAKWNQHNYYWDEIGDDDVIIIHHTIQGKDHEKNIFRK
jgi:hypothetical protein